MSLEDVGLSEFLKKESSYCKEHPASTYFKNSGEAQYELSKYGISRNDALIIASKECFISYINLEGNLKCRKICVLGITYMNSSGIEFVQENLPIRRNGKNTKLFDATPDCDHEIVVAPNNNIKCSKCPGWYCF